MARRFANGAVINLVICCLALVVLTGCTSLPGGGDKFVSLRARLETTLAGRCECGPIKTSEAGGKMAGDRFFEITPANSGGMIVVTERADFDEREWNREHAEMTRRMKKLADKTSLEKNEQERALIGELATLFARQKRPDWRYRGIFVDVENDNAGAEEICKQVTAMLKPN